MGEILPESVIDEIAEMVLKEGEQLSQEDIYWKVYEILENNYIIMSHEEAYQITKERFKVLNQLR